MVKLVLQPGASVARIAREHDINDNLLFKWLRLWQNVRYREMKKAIAELSDSDTILAYRVGW